MLPRVYICDDNPRMRQLIESRLAGSARVIGSGESAQEAIDAAAELEPDVLVLDFRTAVAKLSETVAAIKAPRPSITVVVHTGVPRYLIEDQVVEAGGVYSPKNEPEHLNGLMRSVKPAGVEATSRDS
jgi:two-component system, NarL family, nitrate/nitrite response regulator NarL